MKYLISLALCFIAVVLGIVIKLAYDPFTNATGGVFVTSGVDANTTAFFSALPWIIPLTIFVIAVIMATRRSR